MLLDDAIGKTQAQARSFAHFLGGEERVEYFCEVLLRNAGSIVLQDHLHPALA